MLHSNQSAGFSINPFFNITGSMSEFEGLHSNGKCFNVKNFGLFIY